jgi:hypothetical protein
MSAFPAMQSQLAGAETVLTGLLDRSALYGVLAEIDALGLDLLEVRQLIPDLKEDNSDFAESWRLASAVAARQAVR